jgi:serine/threonine-protein kinase
MAPEQVLGKTPTAQTDIYSLGVMVYELLLGRLPFMAKKPQEIAFMHVHNLPPAPRELRADFPKPLETVILRALAKKPASRYHTAEEFRLAYAHAVEEIESSLRRVEYWAEPLEI